jgi:hypothetical protein
VCPQKINLLVNWIDSEKFNKKKTGEAKKLNSKEIKKKCEKCFVQWIFPCLCFFFFMQEVNFFLSYFNFRNQKKKKRRIFKWNIYYLFLKLNNIYVDFIFGFSHIESEKDGTLCRSQLTLSVCLFVFFLRKFK